MNINDKLEQYNTIEELLKQVKKEKNDTLFNVGLSCVPFSIGGIGVYSIIDTVTNYDIGTSFGGLMFLSEGILVCLVIGTGMLIYNIGKTMDLYSQKKALLKMKKNLIEGYNINIEEIKEKKLIKSYNEI